MRNMWPLIWAGLSSFSSSWSICPQRTDSSSSAWGLSISCLKARVQFSSVAQSCPTLYKPMKHSTPGLPVHHQLQEFTQTSPLSGWCHPTILSSVVPFSSHPESFPASVSFQMSQLFASGDQSTGVSTLASVLPMNIQDWSPLGWTGWISLQSKGLSRVFSNTTQFKSINSLGLSFLYGPTLTFSHDYWKNHSFG